MKKLSLKAFKANAVSVLQQNKVKGGGNTSGSSLGSDISENGVTTFTLFANCWYSNSNLVLQGDCSQPEM